jgi:hypothetical protein
MSLIVGRKNWTLILDVITLKGWIQNKKMQKMTREFSFAEI